MIHLLHIILHVHIGILPPNNCMTYFVLGEGVCNIFVLIHVAANSFFICSRVTIAKCPRWELSPGIGNVAERSESVLEVRLITTPPKSA